MVASAGYSEQQAEATVEAQKQMLSEVLDTTLATREDMHGIETRIAKIEAEITSTKWIMGVILGGIVALLIKAFIK
jgi:phage shock protein A